MVWVQGFVAAMLFLLRCAASVEIDTTDGGYKNILVSISQNVPPDESIIDDIKALFQSSSEFLHKATGGRVYFKHVDIQIPRTWPERSGARTVSSYSFHRSDVRIDLPSKQYEDEPFTLQLAPCGQRGEFIQLTPGFLATIRNSTAKKSLFPAYMFVHEWAHFRYGVFDEYGSRGDSKFPLTFCDADGVRLNACSSRIAFGATTADGQACKITQNCRFLGDCEVTFYNPVKDPVESSIMFMPPVNNVSHFCDNAPSRQHNWLAPNKHNFLCKQKSSWDVIMKNDDFKHHTRRIGSKQIHVTFDEAQHKEGLVERVVLVLDVSTSMGSKNRFGLLKEALQRYIEGIEDGNRRLAIVASSTNSTEVHPLKLVVADAKQGFFSAITSIKTSGRTCIGCGLRTALNILREGNETPEGGFIVLITDGEENRDPKIGDVLPDIVASKAIVSTVALGAKADRKLGDIAVKTHGKAFVFPDLRGKDVVYLENVFVSSTTSQDGTTARTWMLVDEDREFTSVLERKFQVDASIGNSTVVHVNRIGGGKGSIQASLVDPTGRPCQACLKTTIGTDTVIEIPSPAMVGTWKLEVRSSPSVPVKVNIWIKSQLRNNESEPIRASTHVRTVLVDGKNATFVYVKVDKGKKIVLGAVVFVQVFQPVHAKKSQHSTMMRLQDDGQDPDVNANDGVYSGYFTQYIGKGLYTVTAWVSTQDMTRLAEPPRSSGSFFTIASLALTTAPKTSFEPKPWYPLSDFILVNTSTLTKATTDPEDTTQPETTPAVAAETWGPIGTRFGVVSWDVKEDIYESEFPPGRITDLTVTAVRPGKNNTLLVQLKWTWPGAHLTNGNASAVDIRAGKHKADLEKDFGNQIAITQADVVKGHLEPLPAHLQHGVALSIPRTLSSPGEDGALNWDGYLAAHVANSYGLKSGISNIVRVSYVSLFDESTSATTTEATAAETTTTKAATRKAPTREATTRLVSTAEAIRNRMSRSAVSLWLWVLTGSFPVAILIAVLVAALRVLNPKKNVW